MIDRVRELLNALSMRKGHSVLTPVHIAIVLSLSIGFIDLAIDTVAGQANGVALRLVIMSLAATVGFFFLLYLAAWSLVASRIGRFLKLKDMPMAVSLALFVGVIFIFASIHGLISFSPSKAELSKLFMLLVLSSLFSILSYYIMGAVSETSDFSHAAVASGLAIPFLAAEFSLISMSSLSSLSAFILFLSCALITIILFTRLKEKIRVRLSIAVFLILIFLALPLSMIPTPAESSKKGFHLADHGIKHVILITIDALRADFVSVYNRGASTPYIDSLAEGGIVFSRVISAAPWTLPSFSSIMTGLAPAVHMTKGKTSRLPDNAQTLAEYMRDNGYFTGAVVSNPYLTPAYNLSQGFLEYDAYPKGSTGNSFGARLLRKVSPRRFRQAASTRDLTDLALEWLNENQGKDYFFWIHYLDPHGPYSPSEEFLPKGKAPENIGTNFYQLRDIRSGYFSPTLSEMEWIRKLYDGEVRSVDRNIGRLIDTLKRLHMYDDSLIILTSDHGEEFWEHGGFEHGHTLYNELLWVPLIIKLPRSDSKGKRINTVIQTYSIMPTVLDLCGISYEGEHLSVRSLSPLWGVNPRAFEERPVVSAAPVYYEDREALIFDSMKYIHYLTTNREEVYDLTRDPQEQFTIANINPGVIQKARGILKEYHARAKKLRAYYQMEKEAEIEIDQKTMRELKSLGYVK